MQAIISYVLITVAVGVFRPADTSTSHVEHVMGRFASLEDKERLCISGPS